MQVLDVEPVVDGGAAQLVGLADADAPLDAAAGHPHREAVGVVVAAGPLGVLGGRLAAELAAPDDQRLVEQAALLQVLEQAGDRLVGVAGVLGVVGDHVGVGVPVVVVVGAAGVDLDEPHAALDQPPGQQALAAEVGGLGLVDAVQRQRVSRSPGEIDRLGGVLLHLEGQLVAGDPRGQLAVVGARARGARRSSRADGRAAGAARRASMPGGPARGRGSAVRRRGGPCPGRRPACSRSTSSSPR